MDSLKEDYLRNNKGFTRWLIKTGIYSPLPNFKSNNLKDFLDSKKNIEGHGAVIFPRLHYSFEGRVDNYSLGYSPIILHDNTAELKAYVRHNIIASSTFFGRNYLVDSIDRYNTTFIEPILEFNAWSPLLLDISVDPKKIYLIDFNNKLSRVKSKSEVSTSSLDGKIVLG